VFHRRPSTETRLPLRKAFWRRRFAFELRVFDQALTLFHFRSAGRFFWKAGLSHADVRDGVEGCRHGDAESS